MKRRLNREEQISLNAYALKAGKSPNNKELRKEWEIDYCWTNPRKARKS